MNAGKGRAIPLIALACVAISAMAVSATETEPSYEMHVSVLPSARMSYAGEGLHFYANVKGRPSFAGINQPLYRIELRKILTRSKAWGLSFWHTGKFGGGGTALETIPDYQTSRLSPGFTNLFLTRYHRFVGKDPIELSLSASIVRQIFIRSEITVVGMQSGPQHHVNETSAEGIGIGLQGRHGSRTFFRWRLRANHYIQIFDAQTDSDAGQIFLAEAGLGRQWGAWSFEVGYLWQYWFIRQQDERLFVNGASGAIVSWASKDLRSSGALLRLGYRFGSSHP